MSRVRRAIWAISGLTIVFALVLAGPVLPPVAYAMNWLGCALVEAGRYHAASAIFSYVSQYNDANAFNNLGVLYRNGWGVRCDWREAKLLFERAMLRGHHVQAAYNLAELVPNEADVEDNDANRAVALLEANVAAGDTHSAILLATREYMVYGNRFAPVGTRRKLELFEFAASDDDEYKLAFADWLIDKTSFGVCNEDWNEHPDQQAQWRCSQIM